MSTTTFGVGNDFDEGLLADLADAGGGHFYYIADAPQIRDAITVEVGETLEVVGPRRHRSRSPPATTSAIEAITPHAVSRRAAAARRVAARRPRSEQVVEVVLRLSFPYGELGQRRRA